MYPQAKPVTSDPKKIAQNLSKLCLLAQSHGKLVAYEAISWGYNTNTWQQSRDIFHLVDLPNFRHCLDTFHIATKIAADPFNQEQPIHLDGIENLKSSLDELRNDIKPSEIGYMQLSDATVADALQRNYPNQDFNAPPFMTQSRNCRVFPCDTIHQGILPVVDVAKAVFDTGYRGWVSMEVFHTDLWKRDDS
jgi:4-hydroxyphenylpyruvate dioxygenase